MALFTKVAPFDFDENDSAIVGIFCKRKIGKHKNKLKYVCKGKYDFNTNIFTVTGGVSRICDEQVAKDGYSWYSIMVEALSNHDWSDNIIVKNKNYVWKRKNGVDL